MKLYYVYRNLHTNTFSVKWGGLVLSHPNCFLANNVTLKVNQGGRDRVLEEKKKNVHAFVAAEIYEELDHLSLRTKNLLDNLEKLGYVEVTYNPYKYDTFVIKDTEEPVTDAEAVFGYENKIYAKF